MCGIAAIWSTKGGADPARLEAANRAQAHRGPDGSGVWVAGDRRAGLGHVRLAIVGGDGGAQPIASEDGSVIAAVAGELYARGTWRRLRADLESRGHRFATGSDSEVLVHLYEECGLDALAHVRGELAFVLWDRDAGRLAAGRDRFGIKPLCYAERGGELLIASEAKALLAMGLPPAWDGAGLAAVLAHQYLPPGRSLLAGVHQLPPGHVLIADRRGVRRQRYWDLDYPRGSRGGATGANDIAEIRALIDEAVALRVDAAVPVAFHLSGGLDSSAIAGAASARREAPIDAFAVQFDDAAYDELAAAMRVARFCGARLHPVRVSRLAMLEALDDAVIAAETPAINGQLPAKLLLNRAIAAAGFEVVVGGEGADEVFFGYAHLRDDAGIETPGFAAEARIMRAAAGERSPAALAAKLGTAPSFLTAKLALGRRLATLAAPGLAVDQDAAIARLAAAIDGAQLAGRPAPLISAYLWTRLALAGYILRAIGDGTEMACSLEGRLPMLDHALFERVRELPLAALLGMSIEKPILRAAVSGWVPEAIRARPKQPFLAPPLAGGDRATCRALRDRLADAADSRLLDREAVLAMAARLDPEDDPLMLTALSLRALERGFALTDVVAAP